MNALVKATDSASPPALPEHSGAALYRVSTDAAALCRETLLAASSNIQERLRARITETQSGCQEWTGYRDKLGYGAIKVKHKSMLAHRVFYAVFIGPIPEGILVLHKCDNPPCLNSSHLFLGTNQDNMHDRNAKGRARGKSWPGEAHPYAKLTESDVAEIRRMAGTMSQMKIAQMFGICQPHVNAIIHFKIWKA